MLHFSRQEQQSEDVGYGHAEDHQVAEVQNVLGGDDRSHEAGHEEHDLVKDRTGLAEQPHPTTFPVVGPRDHGGEGEEHHGHRQHVREPADRFAEGLRGQGGSVLARDVFGEHAAGGFGVVSAGDHDDQGGHGADKDRVDQGFQEGNDALTNREFRFGCGVGDGRGADTGFVGKGGPLESNHENTHRAAEAGCRGKGPAHDGAEGRGHLGGVGEDHEQSGDHVDGAHGGHDGLRRLRDALQPAQDHCADHDGHDGAVDPAIALVSEEGEAEGYRVQRLVDLEAVAAAQGSADAHDGEQHGQELA